MHYRFSRAALVACATAALAIAAPSALVAQTTGTIRGRVIEAGSSRGLSDAQVSIVGTTRGAVTSANGDYAIDNVPAGAYTLNARRLGYARRTAPVTVTAGAETRVDFQLSIAATQLDAIVTTGTAGAVEKRTVGNAITQIDVADVTAKTNVVNVTDVLTGRSPGVTVAAGSGTPGTASEIRIRGASSLTLSPPVIFIDGVRMSAAGLGNFDPSGQGLSGNSGGQGANALDLINPDDIESMEIIKGPAAATLYGADAANGVIQIITKKGARGQQRAQWGARIESGYNDLGSVQIPNNYTLCTQARISATTAGPNGTTLPLYPGCQGQAVNTLLVQNPLRDLPGGLRKGQLHNFSGHVRGGADRYSYYVSADQSYDEGVMGNSYDRRNSLRTNFTFEPTSQTNFAVNVGVMDGHLRLPLDGESAQGLLFSALRSTPGRISNLPGQTEQGWFTVTPAQSNQYDNETSTQRMTVGTTASYQPFQWFRNRLTLGLDWTQGRATLFAPPNTPVLTGDTLGLTAERIPRNTLYTLDYAGTVDYGLTSNLLTTTSFGSQVVAQQNELLSANGTGLGSPDVTLIGSAATRTAANTYSANNSVGYYVQEQLGWKNRLFATGAVRVDNNSSFGSSFNVITYPKASLSWVLSEEPSLQSFFHALRADDFKFRAAWGEAGHAPAPYSATRTYTIDVVTLGSTSASALRTNAYGNPNLKSERGQELEVGFESNFLNDRLGADFTFYNKTMNDVLVSTTVAPSSGFRGTQQANLGKVNNKGIELALTATPVQLKNFGWESRINLSTNKNRLLSFGDTTIHSQTPFASYGSVQQQRAGYPLGGYWAPYPKRNADGSLLLVNGAIVLDTAVYIGPSSPTRELGWTNTFTIFRDFSIYSLFDYQGGFYNYRGVDIYRCAASQNCIQLNDPNFPASELPIYQAGVSNAPRAVYIHKADFWKLRDLSVTYNLPARWAAKASATAASITLAGHNLALWSSYPGPDPEVNTYGRANAVTGSFIRGDIYAMPMTRRLSAALNLTF